MTIDWITSLFLGMGILFAIIGNIGVLIFPDVYTRLQASSTCATTSVFSFFVAGILMSGFSLMSGKIVVITLFFLISSPVAAHIIARYAWNRDMPPWRRRGRKARRPTDAEQR